MARTLYPVVVIVGIAIGTLMIQMSGLPSILMGGDSVKMIQADDQFKQSVSQNNISAEGSPGSSNDGGFFQFVVGGIGKIIDFAELVLLIPETLTSLDPIPWWFAYPAGLLSQAVAIIGIAETASQREWT